ncbi:hypothetical protein FOCC_FOCC015123 [Frankliniella occidentalis]|nr:hypothetical protein FOCC_FOCC015123 [Frankliniella occidentalis]
MDEEDWRNIEEIIESLEPPFIATKKLQAEQLSLGDMYGAWLECKQALSKFDNDLAKKIYESMEKRERREVYARSNALAGQEKCPALFEYPGFSATLLLDPRYFTALEASEVADGKAFINKLYSRLQEKKKTNQNNAISDDDNEREDEGELSEEDEISVMLQRRDQSRTESATFSVTEVCRELDKFYRETPRVKDRKKPVLEWWEEHKHVWPALYEIALILHSIPATQVSVERLFSSLKFIMHSLRNGLEDTMIEDLVLILNNSHLVKEDILVMINNLEDGDDISDEEAQPNASSSSSS